MRSDEPEKPRNPNAGRDAAVRQRWTVGAIGVERVVEFEIGVPSDEPLPGWIIDDGFSDASGVLVASTAIVVTSAGRTVVVDPWLAFDGDRSDIAAQADRATRLLGTLAEAGTPPEDVHVVINTHVDGVGGNVRPDPSHHGSRWVAAFPNARYCFSSTELRLSSRDSRLDPLRDAGLIHAIEPPTEVVPGVSVEDAPGHREGHMAVRLRSNDAQALIPGHLVISPLQVADPSIALDDDAGLATATRRRLLAGLAERGAWLIAPLMGGPGGGVVTPDGATWRLTPRP